MSSAQKVLPAPLAANVQAIAAALKAHGGCVLTVRYGGCGDSGDIEDVSFDADADGGLEDAKVTVSQERWEPLLKALVTCPVELTFRKACASVADELISFGGYNGYENDEGGGGEITITANGAVSLDHFYRVASVEHEPTLTFGSVAA